jgi:hypothetical protein
MDLSLDTPSTCFEVARLCRHSHLAFFAPAEEGRLDGFEFRRTHLEKEDADAAQMPAKQGTDPGTRFKKSKKRVFLLVKLPILGGWGGHLGAGRW